MVAKLSTPTNHVSTRTQGRFSNLLDDLFSLFSSVEWNAEGFLMIPKGYVSNTNAAEYGKFDIITNNSNFKDSLEGILFIDIFTPNGAGPKRPYQLADLIDKYLAGNSFATQSDKAVTQFRRESNFAIRGPSLENSSMLRSTYQVQFSHFRKDV